MGTLGIYPKMVVEKITKYGKKKNYILCPDRPLAKTPKLFVNVWIIFFVDVPYLPDILFSHMILDHSIHRRKVMNHEQTMYQSGICPVSIPIKKIKYIEDVCGRENGIFATNNTNKNWNAYKWWKLIIKIMIWIATYNLVCLCDSRK